MTIYVTAQRLDNAHNIVVCDRCGTIGVAAANTRDETPTNEFITDHLQTEHGLTNGRVVYQKEKP